MLVIKTALLCLFCVFAHIDFAVANAADQEFAAKRKLINMLAKEFAGNDVFLRAHSYTKSELTAILGPLKLSPVSVGRKMSDAELREKYRELFLTEYGYRLGRRYLEHNSEIFDAVEKVYGVPREVVAAILWVESGFGQNLGQNSVLKALFSYSMQGIMRPQSMSLERAVEWRTQLAYFLAWCKKYKAHPEKFTGSYAGAMGIPQFMPISFVHYVVDGDGDGAVDLFKSHTDAIMSAANYLARHGARRDLRKAIHSYNRSVIYVDTIWEYAENIKN